MSLLQPLLSSLPAVPARTTASPSAGSRFGRVDDYDIHERERAVTARTDAAQTSGLSLQDFRRAAPRGVFAAARISARTPVRAWRRVEEGTRGRTLANELPAGVGEDRSAADSAYWPFER